MFRHASRTLWGPSGAALLLLLGGCEAAPTAPVDGLRAQESRTAVTNPDPRPFHGTTVGHLVSQALAPAGRCPPGLPLLFSYHGEGQATHMGGITIDGGECVFVDPSDPTSLRSGAGEFTIAASNGDWMKVGYVATTITLNPNSPWVQWSADVELKGGAGRFMHAQLVGVVWHGGANMLTGETWSAMDGAIVY
jgi:hypothetical protein